VPSLFTLNIQDERLEGLSGVSVSDVETMLLDYRQRGPLLITHWGLSGPSILKLSAWAARDLHKANYKATLEINFLPSHDIVRLRESIEQKKKNSPKQSIITDPFPGIPKNLWRKLIIASRIPEDRIYAQLSKDAILKLINQLTRCSFEVHGKSIYKEEFVTCGGVSLDEIDFRRMESKIAPGLYFAGEVLDIDGITGGFNFQNAWTTAWIVSQAVAKSHG
jgi:predicted Rossmann fold flavoprotein